MPNDRVDESGKRFGNDMRRIREERDVSVDTIHESTRIAQTLIETFEESGLVDHPAFNRVYLRSFVRSYASAVDVAEDVALNALNAALEGEYTNQLAVEVLDEPPQSEADASPGTDPQNRDGDANEETDRETDAAPTSTDGSGAPSDADSLLDPGSSDDFPSEEAEPAAESMLATDVELSESENGAEAVSGGESSSASETSQRKHPRTVAEGAPSSRSGSPPSSPDEPGFKQVLADNRQVIVLALIVFLVALLISAGIWAAFRGSDSAAPTAADTARSTQPDSFAQAGPVVSSSESPVILGDTLYLTVIAQRDVQGIRIKRDDDLRRPYWIESGEATVFPFQQEAVVEQELSNVRLLLEGVPFPTTRRNAQGRIVITRETAQSFVDTLQGDRPALSVTPDTNFIPAFAR